MIDDAPAPEDLQRAYYARTAAAYDDSHLHEEGAHDVALGLIAGMARGMGARRIVDVGAGTGRGVMRLRELLPEVDVFGLEPVEELVLAGRKKGLDEHALRVADGRRLPLSDGEVDLAIATGVLHHVQTPREVLSEMMRVAARGVFISDSNRFAQGRLPARFAKLGLWSLGLWGTFDRIRTRGKGYMESPGDGIYYSYSVYDDLPLLSSWGTRTMVVPLDPDPVLKKTWLARLGPLVLSPHVLVGALR
jgi:SAM-dependent methyltransferase